MKEAHFFEVSAGPKSEKCTWQTVNDQTFDTAILAQEAARANGVYPFRLKKKMVRVPAAVGQQ